MFLFNDRSSFNLSLNSLFTIVKTISKQLQLVGYNAFLDLIWVQKAEVELTEVFI